MYCTSVGKTILKFINDKEVEEICNYSKIKRLTENTIVDFKLLKKELKKVKGQGYAEDYEENELGVRCIGALVFNHSGEVDGAISISGPTIRVTKSKGYFFIRK